MEIVDINRGGINRHGKRERGEEKEKVGREIKRAGAEGDVETDEKRER